MAKPIKKVLQSIRNGKSIALAIAESDLDAEERDILVMSILDIVRETKRFETKEDWAGRVTERLEKIETSITALIDHERKTRDAFAAMAELLEDVIKATCAEASEPSPAPHRLRLVETYQHVQRQNNNPWAHE